VWLVVGLGNPGEEYRETRHNIGFMVVDEVARRLGANGWRAKFGGELLQAGDALFLKPQEFMNVSGQAVQRAAAFYKVEAGRTLLVHDDIDLPFGRLRVKVGGGHGGHNGVRSVSQQLGEETVRVRCGVGKPVIGKEKVVGHVLGGFSREEQKELPFLIGGGADAVELVMHKGPTAAMNAVNAERPPRS